jgi:hypothetical protein
MADEIEQLSAEEVTFMLKRANLTLPPEQLERFCVVIGRLEAAARRLREELELMAEPANVFVTRR